MNTHLEEYIYHILFNFIYIYIYSVYIYEEEQLTWAASS